MRYENAEPGVGSVLTVFGARGGIGKSTIATNLATALAASSPASVLLIDMDTRFGDVALMLNLKPRYTIADLAAYAGELTPALVRQAVVEHPSGAFVLAAPNAPSAWARVTAEQVQHVVRFAAHQFDYVVLDTPGTFNDIVATAVETADEVIVVCGLDMASVKHTAQMFDLLDANFPPERLLLVLNQVGRRVTLRPEDVQRIVARPPFWTIPYDEKVPLSHSIGEPIVLSHPKSAAAKQLRGLAHKILGDAALPATTTPGLLGRLWPWRRAAARRAA